MHSSSCKQVMLQTTNDVDSMQQNSYIKTERYTGNDFFQSEQQKIFGKSWVMAGLSSRISKPRTHFVCKTPEQSYLITRDEKGQVHAFYNSCLHRGTQLARSSGKGEIQCPYHGWKYTHDGILAKIPKPDGMMGTPCNHGRLRPIHCMERSGTIWISWAEEPPAIDKDLMDIFSDLKAYRFEEFSPVESRDFVFPVNWKLCLKIHLIFTMLPLHTHPLSMLMSSKARHSKDWVFIIFKAYSLHHIHGVIGQTQKQLEAVRTQTSRSKVYTSILFFPILSSMFFPTTSPLCSCGRWEQTLAGCVIDSACEKVRVSSSELVYMEHGWLLVGFCTKTFVCTLESKVE